jgi:hypothetical protein
MARAKAAIAALAFFMLRSAAMLFYPDEQEPAGG